MKSGNVQGRIFGLSRRRGDGSCGRRPCSCPERDETVRRRMEGRQGQQHHQRHDLAAIPGAMPRPEGRSSGGGAGRSSSGCSSGSSSACSRRRSGSGRCARASPGPGHPAEARSGADEARRPPDRRREFTTEAEAKARCPSDKVVWVNTNSKSHVYHYAGTRYYGTTKQGAYMCEADAIAAGEHASKSRIGAKTHGAAINSAHWKRVAPLRPEGRSGVCFRRRPKGCSRGAPREC